MKTEWTNEAIEALLKVDLQNESTWPTQMLADRDQRLGLDIVGEMMRRDYADEDVRRDCHLTHLVERCVLDRSVYVDVLQDALSALLPAEGPAKGLMRSLSDAYLDYWMDAVEIASKIERKMGEALPLGGRFEPLVAQALERAMAL